MISEFVTIRTIRKKEIAELSQEEQKKAKALLQKYKNAGGEYRMERRNESRQYFEQKGWVLPQPKVSESKKVMGYIFIILVFGFWIWFFIFAFSR